MPLSENDKTMEGIDRIYWINLDRSKERRKKMEILLGDSVFQNIPYIKRFPAIDGKHANINKMISLRHKKITNVEYACLLSHLEILRDFASDVDIENTDKDKDEIAMIFEDDITLDFKPYWDKNVKTIIDNAPSDWEIIMLCHHSTKRPFFEYTTNRNDYWSTACYIIRKKTAKRLINEIYHKETRRYALEDNLKHAADDYLYLKCKTYVYKYPLFIYGYNEATTISTSNVIYHNRSRYMIENEYKNPTRKYYYWTSVVILCLVILSLIVFVIYWYPKLFRDYRKFFGMRNR